MNRKKFILLATSGVAALAIPTWYFRYRVPHYDALLTEPGLLSYIWDEETLRTIGKAYRSQFADEDSERILVNLLSQEDAATTEHLVEALQQQIHHDYESNQIVILDGWMLSITEARQCALYSFSTPA